ncbi:MAG: ABC transporter ATP-binding protein [Lachnospiraceae bacterium]|nr:ABC transporter ATP-binding protein [Lachnospiraceae bacterium]
MLHTLGAELKEFKRSSLLTPACMIFEVIMEMLIPLLMASIIDQGVMAGDLPHIYKTGALMLLAAVLGLIGGILGGVYGARASAGLARNLRAAMFRNIQSFSFSNIDKYSTAGLVTRLTTDITNVQNAYQMILRMCMRAPASIIVAMAMAFSISARLSLIYLAAVIFLGLFIFFIMRKVSVYFKEVFEKYDDLNESVQENVSAIRVVKAYVREEEEKKKFHSASMNIYKMFVRAEKTIILNMPVMQLTVYTVILALSWFGAHFIIYGELTTGEMMSMLAYCMNILISLMMLSMIFVMVSMSSASAQRITEVIREESSLKNPSNPVLNLADGSVSFEHVYFSYDSADEAAGLSEKPESYVLTDVDFSVKQGETIGIIGGTGSAKSSLVNLISRLYDVKKGAVKVGGVDVREYDLETLRNQVAVVLQKNELFSGTILDNLRWGNENATEEECRHACKIACADEFIERMSEKYDTFIEQGGSNVSGGQKQRLCIARALLKKPKILILDDSTSAVDTATESSIRKALDKELPEMTRFIIAQRISSVEHADRIVVLDDGKVCGFGTHEELLKNNEIYRDVYESQMGGQGDFDEGRSGAVPYGEKG